MRCQQAQQRLQALLDERADFDTDDAITQHLANCDPCATLAAAYEVLRGRQILSDSSNANCLELPHLANAVLAEVAPSRIASEASLVRPKVGRSARVSSWQTYGWLTAAACVLIAMGLSLPEQDSITSPQPPTKPSNGAALVANNAQPEIESPTRLSDAAMAGSEVFNRAGRSLASISLVRMRWPSPSSQESDQPSGEQFLPRAIDTFRTLLNNEWDTTTPAGGETGYRTSNEQLLLA